jgi:hypothetical protein
MKMQKFFIAAFVATLALSAPGVHADDDDDDDIENVDGIFTNTPASGSCFGHVIQVRTDPQDYYTRIYFRTSSLSNRYYYGRTKDPLLINAALHSLSGPIRVRFHSAFANGCTSSSNRYVGDIYRIRVNP